MFYWNNLNQRNFVFRENRIICNTLKTKEGDESQGEGSEVQGDSKETKQAKKAVMGLLSSLGKKIIGIFTNTTRKKPVTKDEIIKVVGKEQIWKQLQETYQHPTHAHETVAEHTKHVIDNLYSRSAFKNMSEHLRELVVISAVLHDWGKPELSLDDRKVMESVNAGNEIGEETKDKMDVYFRELVDHPERTSEMVQNLLKKWKFSKKESDIVSKLVRYHDVVSNYLFYGNPLLGQHEKNKDNTLVSLAEDVGDIQFSYMLQALNEADMISVNDEFTTEFHRVYEGRMQELFDMIRYIQSTILPIQESILAFDGETIPSNIPFGEDYDFYRKHMVQKLNFRGGLDSIMQATDVKKWYQENNSLYDIDNLKKSFKQSLHLAGMVEIKRTFPECVKLLWNHTMFQLLQLCEHGNFEAAETKMKELISLSDKAEQIILKKRADIMGESTNEDAKYCETLLLPLKQKKIFKVLLKNSIFKENIQSTNFKKQRQYLVEFFDKNKDVIRLLDILVNSFQVDWVRISKCLQGSFSDAKKLMENLYLRECRNYHPILEHAECVHGIGYYHGTSSAALYGLGEKRKLLPFFQLRKHGIVPFSGELQKGITIASATGVNAKAVSTVDAGSIHLALSYASERNFNTEGWVAQPEEVMDTIREKLYSFLGIDSEEELQEKIQQYLKIYDSIIPLREEMHSIQAEYNHLAHRKEVYKNLGRQMPEEEFKSYNNILLIIEKMNHEAQILQDQLNIFAKCEEWLNVYIIELQRIDKWPQLSPQEQSFIREPFPLLFGVVPYDKTIPLFAGECGITEDVDIEESCKVCYVPNEKLEEVRSYFKTKGIKVLLLPIDHAKTINRYGINTASSSVGIGVDVLETYIREHQDIPKEVTLKMLTEVQYLKTSYLLLKNHIEGDCVHAKKRMSTSEYNEKMKEVSDYEERLQSIEKHLLDLNT